FVRNQTIILSATATSGLTVAFTIDASSTAGAGSISGTTLTVTGVGSIVIDANQAGNGSYFAAPLVQRTLVVADNTPPVITVPANITTEATGPSGAVVTFTTSATDNVDGTDATTATPASGSTFALGTTTVNVTS